MWRGKEYFILGLLLIGSVSISIPLSTGRRRCMLSMIQTQDQVMNINAYFPALKDQLPNQSFKIEIINRMTGQKTEQRISSGEYKRELQVSSSQQENSLYEICFSIESSRTIQPFLISYQAEYLQPTTSTALNKYPDSLLKDIHLQQTYKIISNIEESATKFSKKQGDRAKKNQKNEDSYISKTQKLLYVTILEICVIVLVGIYQFFQIKKAINRNC